MNNLVLPVSVGTLPQGFCPTDFQSLANGITAAQSVAFPSSFTGIITSASQPTDTSKAWAQLDSSGRFIRLYTFAQGHWLSQHPTVPGFVMIWPYALPDFTSFDGGDSSPIGPQSGPMWQVAQDASGNPILQAQFPLGVGTFPAIPVGTGTAVNVATAGGEQLHTLTVPEMAPHSHQYFDNDLGTNGASLCVSKNITGGGGGFNGIEFGGSTRTSNACGDPTSGTPPITNLGHNNIPPYYAVYFLQRSNRIFYSI